MIEPTNPATIITPSVLTPSIRPVSGTSIMQDETSIVNEISTAETVRPSDRTSDVHEPRLREAAAPAAFTATVAQSVPPPPALAAVEGAADKLPTPEGGSDGMSSVDEALPEPRETFPRDSARVLTRAEARRKCGQFLRRKWDFETIPHDERTVTAASGRRRTVQVYKESDLQQAVRKRHGTPIYALYVQVGLTLAPQGLTARNSTRGYDDSQPVPSNARNNGAGPSTK
ncbi:hypothetical protein K466DRAFT_566288 [Polyporus arcularius HHB13444]|uniref:Uncharacterized protein n=1 Tax=Polyporus arcularius HHB13444 TaxID=1314778 RepID=A0A5C3PJ51_9APHY|nr:hypothetical protein K466DRAFT_566288 [Polyporus arcularius HHB13444]